MSTAPGLPVAGSRAHRRAAARSTAGSLLAAEWRKMRRTWMLPLTFLGPLGVTLMAVIYYALNGDHVAAKLASGASPWMVLLNAMAMVQVFSLMLGTSLLASQIADVEHRSDTWKQLFAMPVPRGGTFVAKYTWLAALLAVASVLMVAGYAAVWLWRGYGGMPWRGMGLAVALPYLAVLPLAALQLVLSAHVRNQAVPLTVGILAPMFSMVNMPLPGWLPWRLPQESLASVYGRRLEFPQLWWVVAVECVVLVVLGAALMRRREIR